MELDLSLIEINGEDDDSLLRLEDPSDGIFPCSPVHAPRSTHADPSLAGGVRTVQFTENFGGRNSKENVDVNMDGMKLNMDPLKMKRRKKAKGYNMRKSLAWNKAFFTEEGVLDPEELSLVTGTFNLSSGEQLSVIKEEKKQLGKSCSPHVQSPKEKLFSRSPGVGRRGLSPICESSSTRYCVSPAKEISSPHVRRLVLSAQDANKKGEKYNDCPRPKPASSYKRPASSSASSATSKEPKLTKSLIPRADRSSLPTVPRSALPKASCSSRIPETEPKRVDSSPKSVALTCKRSMVNNRAVTGSLSITRRVKGSVSNNSGVKGIAKYANCPKPLSLKEPAKQSGLNKSKLPPKAPTSRDPQVSHVFRVSDHVHQHEEGVGDKHNNVPLPQKCFPDDPQRQVSHVQAGKPTGLRMPSPTLGFFGRSKQSPSLGDSHPSNISETYYHSVRNHDVAQRPLLGQEMVPSMSNGSLEADIRESQFTAKVGEIKNPTMEFSCSPDVLADILEDRPQTLSHNSDINGQKPSKSDKCDRVVDMQALRTYDNLHDINRSYYEQLKCDKNQGKDDSSSLEGCNVSESKRQGSVDDQRISCMNHRSVPSSAQPFEEGTERRKCDSSKAHVDEQMSHFSSLDPKSGENQGLVTASSTEDLKDGWSLEDYCISATESKGSSNHSQPLIKDKENSLDDGDHPSIEWKETSQHDSSVSHPETNESLDGCVNYDPSLQEESAVLDVKVHKCFVEGPKDRNSSELESNGYLSQFKPFTPVAEDNIVEGINREVHVTSDVNAPGLQNVSSLGILNIDSSRSSCSTLEETQFGVSELRASECEPNSLGNFQLATWSSDVLQKPDVSEEDDGARSSYSKDDQSNFVEAEMRSQSGFEHKVEDSHQNNSEYDVPLPMSNDLAKISDAGFDETADEVVLLHVQNDEIMLPQSSNQVTELHEEFRAAESKNCLDLGLSNLKSVVYHERDCTLGANNESTNVDGDDMGDSSSQLKILEKTYAICEADAFTTRNYTDSLSSDKCSPLKTSHLDCSEDHIDMPDAALDVLLKQSSPVSNNLDVGMLESNTTETVNAENDAIFDVAVQQIHENISSDLSEIDAQICSNSTMHNSKPNCVVVKPPPNVVPFSDEWLAAIEAAGEDILTLKSGAVQHSPTEKSLPEPSPWSPVKRNKSQVLGPFDCTKHTSVVAPPADD